MAKGLEQPWSMAFLPDGSMIVTERPGRIRAVRHGRVDPVPVAGVPAVKTGGLQGLMDIALHPRFADNHWVYLTYHKPAGDDGATTLARGAWNGTALVDVRDTFESGATQTEASRITFGPDGMIYMTISAPGNGPHVDRSQDANDYAGKIVRLRDDGSIPTDNPYFGRHGYKAGIFTLGHRNGHALAVNPETGELWATEQGPSRGDEINILRAGRNYGWPIVSYGRDYWGPRISKRPSRDGFEDPAVVWLPSIGVTGMTFYTGNRFPHWKRNVFVGGLRQGGIRGPASCSASCSTRNGKNCAANRCSSNCIREFATFGKDPTASYTCSRPKMKAHSYASNREARNPPRTKQSNGRA